MITKDEIQDLKKDNQNLIKEVTNIKDEAFCIFKLY